MGEERGQCKALQRLAREVNAREEREGREKGERREGKRKREKKKEKGLRSFGWTSSNGIPMESAGIQPWPFLQSAVSVRCRLRSIQPQNERGRKRSDHQYVFFSLFSMLSLLSFSLSLSLIGSRQHGCRRETQRCCSSLAQAISSLLKLHLEDFSAAVGSHTLSVPPRTGDALPVVFADSSPSVAMSSAILFEDIFKVVDKVRRLGPRRR